MNPEYLVGLAIGIFILAVFIWTAAPGFIANSFWNGVIVTAVAVVILAIAVFEFLRHVRGKDINT